MTYLKNNKPTKALVLAAGFGSRLKPLTDHTPKSLVEVGGRPMIDRVIDQIKEQGIADIIVNTHYLADKIQDHLAKRTDVKITISHEPDILETGGGVLNVMQNIANEPLLVVSSDNILGGKYNAIAQVLEEWNPEQMDFLVALKDKKNVSTYAGSGDYSLTAEGKLSYADPKDFIFVGAYIVKPQFFNGWSFGKFRIPDVIAKAANTNANRSYGTVTTSDWLDIGTPEFLKIANEYFKS
jgi:N-acetyl-alpha-D-muramate 1-phosphate uridylyltransferase